MTPGPGDHDVREMAFHTTQPVTVMQRSGESRLTKVARVFAIVRDLVIILLVVGMLSLGGRLAASLRNQVDGGVPLPQVSVTCAHPVTDDYGTYCPDAPAG